MRGGGAQLGHTGVTAAGQAHRHAVGDEGDGGAHGALGQITEAHGERVLQELINQGHGLNTLCKDAKLLACGSVVQAASAWSMRPGAQPAACISMWALLRRA